MITNFVCHFYSYYSFQEFFFFTLELAYEYTNPGSCLLMTAALEIISMPLPVQQLVKGLINTAVAL